MIEENIESLKYPIGKFSDQHFAEAPYSDKLKEELLLEIKVFPKVLEMTIQNLDADQLATPYRDGGWTVAQVVHHLADTHMNAFMRFKKALTENNPTVEGMDQDKWAQLPDSKLPVNISLTLLHAIHIKWFELLKDLPAKDWQNTYYHAAKRKTYTLWDALKTYVWHGKHHTAQITALIKRKKW